MRKVYSAGSLAEAYLLLHALERAAIPARVLNEHTQGGAGEIPFVHAYPELWVDHDADAERARAVITEFESARPVSGVSRCAGCGEENPSTFELCWHCGATLKPP